MDPHIPAEQKELRIPAEMKELHERADKLEREANEIPNKLPQDPDERKIIIAYKLQEASKLREDARKLRPEMDKRCKCLRDQADEKEQKENEMIIQIPSLDPEIAELYKQKIEDIRQEKLQLRKEACRLAAECDEDNEVEGCVDHEEDKVQEDAVDAVCYSTTNPNATDQNSGMTVAYDVFYLTNTKCTSSPNFAH